MSEIAGQTGLRGAATAVVNESYSFACMRCGHGWEQAYEIEHHVDTDGHQFVMYVAEGQVVPSPLSRPACHNCDGHVVRIMRAGQVSSVRDAAQRQYQTPRPRPVTEDATDESAVPVQEPAEHHWHLSDLLHPFHHRKAS
jgi:Zn finger protein HypA/HybF involved in hydrogenase expression